MSDFNSNGLLAAIKKAKRLVSLGFTEVSAWMTWRGLRVFLESNLASVPKAARVLNVGSGGRVAGVLEKVQARAGFDVVSIDLDPLREPDIVGDIITYETDEKFDVIIMMEVLEHVTNPHNAISNIQRLLKPRGLFLMSTPFLFPIHDRPIDFFRFTRFGLAHLLSDFDAVHIKARDSWAEVFCVMLTRLNKEKLFPWRILGLGAVVTAALLYPLAMLLSWLLPADGYTSGYTAHAKKKA